MNDRSQTLDPPNLRLIRRRGTLALTEREVMRVLRLWSQTILPPVLAAVLFIVVFGVALGGQIRTVDGIPYETFIVPGLVLMGVATSAFANTATSIYQARSDGFIEDPAGSPMAPRHLLMAYLSGGLVRGLAIGVATLLCARVLVTYPLERPVLLAGALIATSLAFSALGIVVGLLSEGWEFQSVVGNLIIQPLVFLGGVFYSVSVLAEPWRALTHADPIYHMVVMTRVGLVGHHDGSLIAATLVTLACAVAMGAWAWLCLARGTGIRT